MNDFHKILWVCNTLERQQYDTTAIPGKSLKLKKYFLFFYPLPSVATKPLKLRVVYLRNEQMNCVTNMDFYKHD